MAPDRECVVVVVVAGSGQIGPIRQALRSLNCRPVFRGDVAAVRTDPACRPLDLLIVSHRPPEVDAFQAVRELRAAAVGGASAPILVCVGEESRALRRTGIACGATDVVCAPEADPLALSLRAAPLLEFAGLRRETALQLTLMAEETERALAETAAREREIIRRLMLAAEFRENTASNHLTRVAGCVIAIAEALGLSEDVANDLALASTMHDVGKIGVPDHILLKPGPLTDGERQEMMQHAVRGYRMLQGSSSRLLALAAEIALTHHERWDGTGYPQGLSGTRIPLSGRITAVADVFDALIADRPYKRGWRLDDARRFIEEQAGSHFDPACVTAFLSRWTDIVALIADHESEAHAA